MSAPLLRVIAHRRDVASEPERWGYIDQTGRLAIEHRFDDAGDFHDGRARVVLDGQPTFIDATGTPVMRSRYQQLGDFAEGRACVGAYGKHGYVDRAGELVIALRYDGAQQFSEGVAAVRDGDRWGYVDRSGTERIAPRFDEADRFSEGVAAVRIGDGWTYIDTSGELMSKPCLECAHAFSEGLAAVRLAGRFGYIGPDGTLQIEPEFDSAREFHEGLASVGRRVGAGSPQCRWHFIDRSGRQAMPLSFEDVFGAGFSEGLAAVEQGPHCSVYCAHSGEVKIAGARFCGGGDGRQVVVRPISSGGSFVDGIARVMIQPVHQRPGDGFRWDDMAYIDTDGDVVWGAPA